MIFLCLVAYLSEKINIDYKFMHFKIIKTLYRCIKIGKISLKYHINNVLAFNLFFYSCLSFSFTFPFGFFPLIFLSCLLESNITINFCFSWKNGIMFHSFLICQNKLFCIFQNDLLPTNLTFLLKVHTILIELAWHQA